LFPGTAGVHSGSYSNWSKKREITQHHHLLQLNTLRSHRRKLSQQAPVQKQATHNYSKPTNKTVSRGQRRALISHGNNYLVPDQKRKNPRERTPSATFLAVEKIGLAYYMKAEIKKQQNVGIFSELQIISYKREQLVILNFKNFFYFFLNVLITVVSPQGKVFKDQRNNKPQHYYFCFHYQRHFKDHLLLLHILCFLIEAIHLCQSRMILIQIDKATFRGCIGHLFPHS